MQRSELWYPGAASTGLLLARGRLDPTTVLRGHAAPDRLEVLVPRQQEPYRGARRGLTVDGRATHGLGWRFKGNQLRGASRWFIEADLGNEVILSVVTLVGASSGGTHQTDVSGAGELSSFHRTRRTS